jgi:SAM-dependent methyltransferase
MKDTLEAYQTHWHPEEIFGGVLQHTAGSMYVFRAWDWAVQTSAHARGPAGRVLDTACGNAREITWLSALGWEAVGLDPSLAQLADARRSAERGGQTIRLVRGVAEWLPFKTGVFDTLINKSALDHLVEPDRAVRDFARVLRPGGRAVVSANNYGSITSRLSRLSYRLARAVWPPARRTNFFWDSPVPVEHTYECTFDNTRDLGAPYFTLLDVYGVSLLWGLPVWTTFLQVLPGRMRRLLLRVLNRLARRTPRHADVFVFIWQPKAETGQ